MTSTKENQIARAALAEFALRGYEGTTTKRIAKLSHVSEGSIFRIFESKEKLFQRCVELSHYENQSSGDFAKELLSNDFRRAVMNAVHVILTNVGRDHVRLMFYGLLERPSAVRDALVDVEASRHLLANRIEQERSAGGIRTDVDSSRAAEFLLDSIASFQVRRAVEKQSKTSRHAVRLYVDLWCSALTPESHLKGRKHSR